MRIGIVYYGVYPWNRGIDQLAQSLRYLGYEPIIVARFPESNERVNEVNNIPVIQVPPSSRGRIQRLKVFPIPFNLFWRNWLVGLGRKFHWQGIIVRETPLSWPVLSAARKLAIPAYLDMRENLIAMYQSGIARNVILRILRNPSLVRLYERVTIPQFEHVFTVSEELKEWLLRSYNVRPPKVSVLENTPHEEFLQAAEAALNSRSSKIGFVRLVYAGSILERKGIGDVISCFPYVLQRCPQARLRIIGDGPALSQMKELVHSLDLGKVVEFLPMLSMQALAEAIAECDIGIESSRPNEHTNQTLPGKLFEYMTLGIPLISSARNSVMRILNEVGCGQVYYSRDPQSIAACVTSLISNQKTRHQMGKRARKAILNSYNWRFTLKTLKTSLGE